MTTLTPVAQRRITSEMKDWINLPPEGCKLTSCEPMTQWVVEIEGPLMYTGEVFHLRIIFTERYPLEPPTPACLANPRPFNIRFPFEAKPNGPSPPANSAACEAIL